jgi:hypothetical protein
MQTSGSYALSSLTLMSIGVLRLQSTATKFKPALLVVPCVTYELMSCISSSRRNSFGTRVYCLYPKSGEIR